METAPLLVSNIVARCLLQELLRFACVACGPNGLVLQSAVAKNEGEEMKNLTLSPLLCVALLCLVGCS